MNIVRKSKTIDMKTEMANNLQFYHKPLCKKVLSCDYSYSENLQVLIKNDVLHVSLNRKRSQNIVSPFLYYQETQSHRHPELWVVLLIKGKGFKVSIFEVLIGRQQDMHRQTLGSTIRAEHSLCLKRSLNSASFLSLFSFRTCSQKK